MEDKFQQNEGESNGLMEEQESFDTHGSLNEEELKYMYHKPSRRKKSKMNPMYEKAIYIGGASVLGVILFLAILIQFTGKDKKQSVATTPTMSNTTYDTQQIEDLKAQILTVIQTNQSLQDEVFQLSQDNEELKQEVEALKTALQPYSQSRPVSSEQTSKNSGQQITSYIVKQGDTLWSISEKIYGSGAYHTKIMEANGLQESSGLKAGMELKIPKL